MSTYRSLFLWFEGTNDSDFIERILLPRLRSLYTEVQLQPYAQLPDSYVMKYLKSLTSMSINYIFFADLDAEPCVTQKKAALRRRYSTLDLSKVIIVKKEIESWYLAGLDGAACAVLGVRPELNTETIDKERFNQMLPKNATPRINAMIEMLNHYDIETARQKNQSFAYFAAKYGL